MTKATFIIRGTAPNDETKLIFQKQEGYLWNNGNQWFGVHNINPDKTGKKEWNITHLPTGLRMNCGTFPTLKKAQEYIESEAPIIELKGILGDEIKREVYFNEKQACSILYNNDRSMWNMAWRIYGWEYQNAQKGIQSDL